MSWAFSQAAGQSDKADFSRFPRMEAVWGQRIQLELAEGEVPLPSTFPSYPLDLPSIPLCSPSPPLFSFLPFTALLISLTPFHPGAFHPSVLRARDQRTASLHSLTKW